MFPFPLLATLCFVLLMPAAGHANLDDGIAAYNKRDYITAFNEFHSLAQSGDAKAQLLLGLMHDNGLGTARDLSQAFYWYKQSAGRGNTRAQYNVGEMLALGQGVDEDKKQALEWFRRSAEGGFAEAQYKLGLALSQGDTSEQNLVEAYVWLGLASSQQVEGSDVALLALDELKMRMKPSEVIEAEKQITKWKKHFSEKQQNRMIEI